MPSTIHEQAVDILQGRIEKALGRELRATAGCNECPDDISIDLAKGATSVRRAPPLGSVIPDLALFDEDDEPITLVEVVLTHPPERHVHEYAIENDILVVEFDLSAADSPPPNRGTRRKALSEALVIKARLRELREGRLRIDAHNLLCDRPRCGDCGTPLPRRTITVLAKDCWKCSETVRVAVGRKDSGHIYPEHFTPAEREFAGESGVSLEFRYSATRRESYLANVCRACGQMQGNFFLYQDPFHDTYQVAIADRHGHEGPCDKCAECYCSLHGTYHGYEAEGQCPNCLDAAKVTLCRDRAGRECYHPDTCDEHGCYFSRRDEEQHRQAEQRIEAARKSEEETLAAMHEEAEPLRSLIKGCSVCSAPRKEFRFQDGQAFCTRCGAEQGPDHFRT